LYAQNDSNVTNSKTIGHDVIYFSNTVNNSNNTINNYDTLMTSSSSNSSFNDINAKNNVLKVTLDVFSGRPNPTWTLTKEQTPLVLNNVSHIKTTTDDLQNYPEKILGYRGFIVDEKTNKDLTSKKFEIYNGTIGAFFNDSSFFLKDKDFGLEKWLLQTAYNHVDNDTFDFVKEDIANRK
jgi:hypothetical protein